MKALRSLGKQLPPKPSEASRNRRPMRASMPMPLATSCTLAPEASQITEMALMYEIFRARNELAACLINSAELMSVTMIGALNGANTDFIAATGRGDRV